MKAGKYDITIEQGAGFEVPLSYRADGDLVDLTGSRARLQMREKVGSSVVLVELTTENDGITLGGVGGTISLTMTADATSALRFSRAVYDLEIVPPSNEPYRLLEGNVFLDR